MAHEEEVRAIVSAAIAEQQHLQRQYIEDTVLGAMKSILTSFGLEEEDRRELRADLQHLRRWRTSVEQAQGYTFKAIVTVLTAGLLGAIWLGVKVSLGK